MELRTLRKCKWKDIAIGEVFATNSCWIIGIKRSEQSYRILAEDYTGKCISNEFQAQYNSINPNNFTWNDSMTKLYKLSKDVQALWKTE